MGKLDKGDRVIMDNGDWGIVFERLTSGRVVLSLETESGERYADTMSENNPRLMKMPAARVEGAGLARLLLAVSSLGSHLEELSEQFDPSEVPRDQDWNDSTTDVLARSRAVFAEIAGITYVAISPRGNKWRSELLKGSEDEQAK